MKFDDIFIQNHDNLTFNEDIGKTYLDITTE